ncbi:PAQR family membrane homeostasis protein TrhA [Paenibacillus alkalitolerans]|uniref:PAQR family membrane homeostasis protein TrhA n=1 Tax=Paenibacillus alkalitolerans TaxID=2799335 RepID=UPI0018F335DC|nr:hemolysin III family protein [Paenibacillus alkalitolerans]
MKMKWLRMKEPANTITHLIPFVAGIAGLVFLILETLHDAARLTTGIIFGASVILLYGASTAYHWIRTTPGKVRMLRKLDHIAIFLLIAGTYTPVLYFGLEGWWRWSMLISVYVLSLIGILMKVWFIQIPRSISTAFYIALGWIALIPLAQIVNVFPIEAFVLMILGGVAYTVGGIIYATKIFNFVPNKFGFHEVFHIFVSVGTLLHFVMIAFYILPE